jgi:TolB-like protein
MPSRTFATILVCASVTLAVATVAPALGGREPPAGASVAESTALAPSPIDILTVAVLQLQARDEQLARDVTEILAADLSRDPRLALVERARVEEVLEEQGYGKAGIVDAATASDVGYLVGAEVLVWGRVFMIDHQVMIIGRVVGVETGRVFVEQARGEATDDIVPLVDELADRIAGRIGSERSALLAPNVSDDMQANLNELAAQLEGRELPKTVISVSEGHIGDHFLDPAAEIELMYWFSHCGFPLIDISETRKQLREWAKSYYLRTSWELPHLIPEDVAVLLVGEAFSEPAGRYGPLCAVRYRVEVRALDRATGHVIAVARRTGTYADATMVAAGKTGIQRAAAGIAYELIPAVVGHAPAGPPTEVSSEPVER